MLKIILKVLANAGAVYVAARLIDGVNLNVNLNDFSSFSPILILIRFFLFI